MLNLDNAVGEEQLLVCLRRLSSQSNIHPDSMT